MKLNSIQFLRAVAALLVVYEHSMDVQIQYGTSAQQKFFHLDNFGCIGVDLFFVISGFIITYVANKYNGLDEGMHFLTKRFWRINPVYYIASLIFLGLILLQTWVNKGYASDSAVKLIGSFFDTLLVIPIANDVQNFKPILIVGWTLSYEWLFYLLFLILILLNIKSKTVFLSGLILLLIVAGQLLKPNDLRLQFITNPIMLEFVLGVIICQLYVRCKKIQLFVGVTCLTIGLLGYGSLIRFGYGYAWHYLGTINGTLSMSRFLLFGLPSSCIVAGCIFLEKNGRLNKFWNNKWVLLGGDASYSIYLIHYTIFGLLMLLYTKTGFFLPPDAMIWLQMFVAVAASIIFYKLVEKPLLKYLNNIRLWEMPASIKPTARLNETTIDEKVKPATN